MQRQTVTKKKSQKDKEVRNKDPQPSETHHALSVHFQKEQGALCPIHATNHENLKVNTVNKIKQMDERNNNQGSI